MVSRVVAHPDALPDARRCWAVREGRSRGGRAKGAALPPALRPWRIEALASQRRAAQASWKRSFATRPGASRTPHHVLTRPLQGAQFAKDVFRVALAPRFILRPLRDGVSNGGPRRVAFSAGAGLCQPGRYRRVLSSLWAPAAPGSEPFSSPSGIRGVEGHSPSGAAIAWTRMRIVQPQLAVGQIANRARAGTREDLLPSSPRRSRGHGPHRAAAEEINLPRSKQVSCG